MFWAIIRRLVDSTGRAEVVDEARWAVNFDAIECIVVGWSWMDGGEKMVAVAVAGERAGAVAGLWWRCQNPQN